MIHQQFAVCKHLTGPGVSKRNLLSD